MAPCGAWGGSCAQNGMALAPASCTQVDRLYNWKSVTDAPIRDSFKRQKEHVMTEFEQRSSQVFLQLNELVGGGAAR